MINRVQHVLDEHCEDRQYDYFYTVETACDRYCVSFDTVLAIEYQLDRAHRPVWIEFRDLFGARQRVLSHLVVRISESTPAARASMRAFRRARDEEDRRDDSEGWKEGDHD